jgi:hypothetical protein
MLKDEIVEKINEFVAKQPRSIQEIAELLKCSWITADRYVEAISKKYGNISVKVFRKGTRGALKVVYLTPFQPLHTSVAQESLFEKIIAGKRKEDFRPFDIFQYAKKKKFIVEKKRRENEAVEIDIVKHLSSTENQLLIFSGNLSFVNIVEKGVKVLDVIKNLAKKGVTIKVLSRVEIPGIDNVLKVLSINKALGREAIEIRHAEQPLRGEIIDDKLVRLREEWEEKRYKNGELDYNLAVFYEIYDKEWVEWLQKVFWHIFNASIPAESRMKELGRIKKAVLAKLAPAH